MLVSLSRKGDNERKRTETMTNPRTIITASECVNMNPIAILDALAPGGNAVAGVTVEQDWNAGITAFRFEDGSAVVIDGRDVLVIDVPVLP